MNPPTSDAHGSTALLTGAPARVARFEAAGHVTAHQEVDARVAILGLGYVGLPTALAYAKSGHEVIGIDISAKQIERIQDGRADLLPADNVALARALKRGDLALAMDSSAVESADAVVLCVPTPLDRHLLPDLSILKAACEQVVRHAQHGQLIVLTSTTYPGTTRDLLIEPLSSVGLVPGRDINVAFSPERINPGVDSHAHYSVPRVVGAATAECAKRAERLLGRVTESVHVVSSAEAAELSKLFENSFRAVNISLVNEFADACSELKVDVVEVLDAAATKPYGFMRFSPGPGVGGHCIPCDPHYLLWQLRRHRHRMPIVETAMHAIEQRPLHVVDRVRQALNATGARIADSRILFVGVTYKPDIEDVRESPAIPIVERLLSEGAKVTLADAHAPHLALDSGEVLRCTSLSDLDLSEYDLVVLHTRHQNEDLSCLKRARAILDATYSLPKSPNVSTL